MNNLSHKEVEQYLGNPELINYNSILLLTKEQFQKHLKLLAKIDLKQLEEYLPEASYFDLSNQITQTKALYDFEFSKNIKPVEAINGFKDSLQENIVFYKDELYDLKNGPNSDAIIDQQKTQNLLEYQLNSLEKLNENFNQNLKTLNEPSLIAFLKDQFEFYKADFAGETFFIDLEKDLADLQRNEFLNADTDGDGLTNREELLLGTDPFSFDTDGDLMSDFDEISYGTDPLSVNQKDPSLNTDEIWESSEALQQSGTKEQYNLYVNAISCGELINPTSGALNQSKVNDILFHGTTKDEFLVYNSKAGEYVFQLDNLKENTHVGTKQAAQDKIDLNKLNPDNFDFLRTTDLIVPIIANINPKHILDQGDFNTSAWDNEIKKAQQEGYNSLSYQSLKEDKGSISYVLFDSKQAHILGSKQDIEAFKNFASILDIKQERGADLLKDLNKIANGKDPLTFNQDIKLDENLLSEIKDVLNENKLKLEEIGADRPKNGGFNQIWDDEDEDYFQDFKKMVELKEEFLKNPVFYTQFIHPKSDIIEQVYLPVFDNFKVNKSTATEFVNNLDQLANNIRIPLVTFRDLSEKNALSLDQIKSLRNTLLDINDAKTKVNSIRNYLPEGTRYRVHSEFDKKGEVNFSIQKNHNVYGWRNLAPTKDFPTTQSKNLDTVLKAFEGHQTNMVDQKIKNNFKI